MHIRPERARKNLEKSLPGTPHGEPGNDYQLI